MVASPPMTGNEYRISYERQGDDLILQMGPQHPSTHGVLRLELTLDGELVKHVRPHIGYLHRCFEKHAEAMTYPQVIPYADRMDYVGAMCQELGYVLTVEKLMGLTDFPDAFALYPRAHGGAATHCQPFAGRWHLWPGHWGHHALPVVLPRPRKNSRPV